MSIKTSGLVAVLLAASMPVLAQQGGQPNANMNDFETHLIRGLAQRQAAQVGYDQLAVEKASSELTRAAARKALAVHTAGQTSISDLGKKLGAWGEVGKGPMDPRSSVPGPVQGNAQGGAPGGTAGMGAGGPPGGMSTPPGGSFADALKSASGGEFDRLYLLLTILQNEEMQRAIALEIESVGQAKTNAEIVAWSKDHVETYRGVARTVQKAARGEGDSADNPLERERGAADAAKQ
jgi:hypothetical protein